MAAGDTLRRITPQDSWILDSSGNVVGLKNPNANGADLRYDPASFTVTGARLANWARAIMVTGLQPVSVMASPPTLTLADSQLSSLNASNNAAGLPAAGLYPNLNLTGVQSTAVNTGNPNNNCLFAYGPDNTDGSKHVANLLRVRFTIIQPQFEVVFAEQNGCRINALVDDGTGRAQFVGLYDGNSPPGLQSGGTRYQKFDFGADVLSSGIATPNISAAGTGYTRGDVITMSGGTFTRAAKFVVKFVTGGVPGALAVADPGDYTVLPSFPAATTGGTGTGLTIATGFTFPRHTTAKPRKVELLIEGALLYGINYATWAGTEAVITPYKFNSLAPKMYWLGDSQDANTYGTFAGGQVGYLAALRLGMADNIVIDAQGGTGFNVANGTSPAFEHANRVNAVIAAAPDVVVFPYSQNVASNTQATSQAAALSFITTLQNALPNTLFVMVGPAFGFQAWHLAAMQYVMANAPAPSRIRMVDNITEGWAAGGSSGFLTNDSTHWGEWGNVQWRSVLLAEGIKNSLLSMMA